MQKDDFLVSLESVLPERDYEIVCHTILHKIVETNYTNTSVRKPSAENLHKTVALLHEYQRKGININACGDCEDTDPCRTTILYDNIHKYGYDICKAILELGGDPNFVSAMGTGLDVIFRVSNSMKDVNEIYKWINLFVLYDANLNFNPINTRNPRQYNPLVSVCTFVDVPRLYQVLRYMIEAGAEPRMSGDELLLTVVHRMRHRRSSISLDDFDQVIILLVANGAVKTGRDPDGKTPYERTQRMGMKPDIRKLLKP